EDVYTDVVGQTTAFIAGPSLASKLVELLRRPMSWAMIWFLHHSSASKLVEHLLPESVDLGGILWVVWWRDSLCGEAFDDVDHLCRRDLQGVVDVLWVLAGVFYQQLRPQQERPLRLSIVGRSDGGPHLRVVGHLVVSTALGTRVGQNTAV